MRVSDEYFNNCKKIAERKKKFHGRKVRYNTFSWEGGIVAGSNKSVSFIRENTYGPLRIFGLNDGSEYSPGSTVLFIEGNFNELVNLETTHLGALSYSGSATEMKSIVGAADGIPVIDMSARHFPWQIIEEVALAAYLGGAAGTSTEAGYDYVQRFYHPGVMFKLFASLPHAMAAVVAEMAEEEGLFPSVMAAKLFHEAFPDKPITVLPDYEGKELEVVRQAFELFGKKLFAVRLDMHGGRHMQGTFSPDEEAKAINFLKDKARNKVDNAIIELQKNHGLDLEKVWKYLVGNGVTVESVFVMREFLDSIGAKHVKIIVSSGFNKNKTSAFRMTEAPMDFIGTGSYVRFSVFTSDISHVWEKGKWVPRGKVGRHHNSLENHPLLYERK